jgi:hypothetical protein
LSCSNSSCNPFNALSDPRFFWTRCIASEEVSSIGREGKIQTPNARLENYIQYLSHGQGVTISGRNVFPYESTEKFLKSLS